MSNILKPENSEQIIDIIKQADRLELIGTGTKRNIGNLIVDADLVDLSLLDNVELYEPEELVISLGAGCRRKEIDKLLAGSGQQFAFEPPDFSHLLGCDHTGTIGGMVASGLSGPRRMKAGGVRDFVLGVHAVSGRAEKFKTGGRVMKNVTGYDLSKVITGSWGTLAIMSKVTLKILPKPEMEVTLCLDELDNDQAVRVMSLAMRSSCDVSSAAHIPGSATMLRLEGFESSVRARVEMMKNLLKKFGDIRTEEQTSADIWADIRDVRHLSRDEKTPVWRICVPPASGAEVLRAIEDKIEAKAFLDWAGGLIWLEVVNHPADCADDIRQIVSKYGGHATLIRASTQLRKNTQVFQPQPKVLADLSKRLKQSFDPDNILNPGRM